MHSDGNVFKIRGVCFKVIYLITKILDNDPLKVLTKYLFLKKP